MSGDREIEKLASREVYANPWIRVREDQVRLRNGSTSIYGVVEKPDYVVVGALDEGRIHLVQQYRYPVDARHWELPQGHSDAADPLAMAETELREETGLRARTWRRLGFIHQGAGTLTNGYHGFVATDLESGPSDREATEADMVTRAFPVEEVLRMVADGQMSDASSVSMLMLMKLNGLI